LRLCMAPLEDLDEINLHNGSSNKALFVSKGQSTGTLSSSAVLDKPLLAEDEQRLAAAAPSTKIELPSVPDAVPDAVAAPEEQDDHIPHKGSSKQMRRIVALAALCMGTVVAGLYGYRWWQFASAHETTDNATVAGHIHTISSRVNGTIAEVLVQENQSVQKGQTLIQLDSRDFQVAVEQAQAALDAARRKASSAQSSVGVATQTAQGQTTQAQGDVGSAISAIDSAKALLNESQAGVPTAEAAVKEAQAGVSVAQSQVTQAVANLRKLEADYRRYESLYGSGAIAKQQLDAAKNAYDVALAAQSSAQQGVLQARARVAQANQGVSSAQAKVAQAQQGITSAQANLAKSRGGLEQAGAATLQTDVSQGDYGAAKAAIAQALANLKAAQLQLSYTRITAPTAGRVGRKSAEVGQRVQTGSQLMAIVDPQVWVTANFKETQLERIQSNEAVEVMLDAFPHHVFKGRVESVSPASGAQFSLLPPDNATGNFTKIVQRVPVKIILDPNSVKGYEPRISPGMSAEASITVQ
jgi:membrane fusion protein, multidrug efflux system